MKRLLFLGIMALVVSCNEGSNTDDQHSMFDLQGHRWARGLFPENSIQGFVKAFEMGVTTLEMDLAVSMDGQLVVTHDPFILPTLCTLPNGDFLDSIQPFFYNIYQMDYQDVSLFDCGSLPLINFPNQLKEPSIKPLLSEVLDRIEWMSSQQHQLINYNIELKSSVVTDNLFHPAPNIFADLVYQLIDQKTDWQRVTIQSFDFRVLQYFHSAYPQVKLALLIENELPWESNIDSLGFLPQVYSCEFILLDSVVIGQLKAADMKVIPWTVNDTLEMKQLMRWGVDGLITDYPNIAIDLLKRKND